MGTPQLIVLLLMAMGWGITLVKDGERQANYSIVTHTISTMITLGLLYWGGFFS